MKKFMVLGFVFVLFALSAYAKNAASGDKVIKNKMFSVTIPEKYNNLYKTEVKKDRISIYDKDANKAGFGGFAFAVRAYEKPSEHAMLPGSKKIGELTDKNGILYDMVLKFPTDVQYDYRKESVPDSYKALYDLGSAVDIAGVNGSKYFKNQGMKGEDLYKEVLKKHVTAVKEKWDSSKLEENEMSYMYNVLEVSKWVNNRAKKEVNVLDKVGYAYSDINGDGIDELLIGEIADGDWKGVIYDIYTMVNREPKHVVSGGSRDRYFACNSGFVCNEYSGGANESGMRVYILVENSTELFPQIYFKYDGYQNPEQPWFLSYGGGKDWDNIDEKTFNERKKIFERYQRFDFIPLNKADLK